MCGYVRVCVRGFNCHVMDAQKCGITAQEIRPFAFIK